MTRISKTLTTILLAVAVAVPCSAPAAAAPLAAAPATPAPDAWSAARQWLAGTWERVAEAAGALVGGEDEGTAASVPGDRLTLTDPGPEGEVGPDIDPNG